MLIYCTFRDAEAQAAEYAKGAQRRAGLSHGRSRASRGTNIGSRSIAFPVGASPSGTRATPAERELWEQVGKAGESVGSNGQADGRARSARPRIFNYRRAHARRPAGRQAAGGGRVAWPQIPAHDRRPAP